MHQVLSSYSVIDNHCKLGNLLMNFFEMLCIGEEQLQMDGRMIPRSWWSGGNLQSHAATDGLQVLMWLVTSCLIGWLWNTGQAMSRYSFRIALWRVVIVSKITGLTVAIQVVILWTVSWVVMSTNLLCLMSTRRPKFLAVSFPKLDAENKHGLMYFCACVLNHQWYQHVSCESQVVFWFQNCLPNWCQQPLLQCGVLGDRACICYVKACISDIHCAINACKSEIPEALDDERKSLVERIAAGYAMLTVDVFVAVLCSVRAIMSQSVAGIFQF